MTLNLSGASDDAFLELMQYYEQQDMLHSSEDLIMKLREHLELRFDFMRRDTLLKFCNFLRELGLFFEDSQLIMRLEHYFKSNYHDFELAELFELMKLQAYCFYKPENFLQLMFDSVWIRVQQPEQLSKLTANDMLNFVEALTVNGQANR